MSPLKHFDQYDLAQKQMNQQISKSQKRKGSSLLMVLFGIAIFLILAGSITFWFFTV